MRSGRLYTLLAFCSTIALLSQCIERNPVTTIDDTRKYPVISGKLYNSDGTAGSNVKVNICAKNSLVNDVHDIIDITDAKLISTTTDNSGVYSFAATLEPGMYVVSAQNDGDAALIDSVEIKNSNVNMSLQDATLKPVGAIKGKILNSDTNAEHNCYVLAFGTNRFTQANQDGSFFLNNLAEGTYKLRAISDYNEFGVFDTANVEVFSSETTDIASVELPGDEALIPDKVKLVFDTLQQLVSLSWNRNTDARVKRYAVYRRLANDPFDKYLNLFSSVNSDDTLFIDSLCIQDKTYEYYVRSLTKNNIESQNSQHCTVTITSNLIVDTVYNSVIPSDEIFPVFTVSPQGDIYLPIYSAKKIEIRDSTMRLKGYFAEGIYPYNDIRYYDNNIFLVHPGQDSVKTIISSYSATGAFLDTVIKENRDITFDAGFGLIAAAFSSEPGTSIGSVKVYSLDGTLKNTWNHEPNFKCIKVIITNENELLLLLYSTNTLSYKINFYDISGNKKSEKILPGNELIHDIAYDSKRELLYIAKNEMRLIVSDKLLIGMEAMLMGRIHVYNKNDLLVACYNVCNSGPVTSMTLNGSGNLYVGLSRIGGVNPAEAKIIKLKINNR
ncbi:MAG: hypothetical protein GX556_06805 [Fibrobacter sp.]|nr:hypothetical protein [Fibrobacter sp.]